VRCTTAPAWRIDSIRCSWHLAALISSGFPIFLFRKENTTPSSIFGSVVTSFHFVSRSLELWVCARLVTDRQIRDFWQRFVAGYSKVCGVQFLLSDWGFSSLVVLIKLAEGIGSACNRQRPGAGVSGID